MKIGKTKCSSLCGVDIVTGYVVRSDALFGIEKNDYTRGDDVDVFPTIRRMKNENLENTIVGLVCHRVNIIYIPIGMF